jgi:hypothetical protein
MAMRVSVNAKVQNTLDPDQWYRGSSKRNERAKFLETFHNFKAAIAARPGAQVEFKFLTILLLGCDEEAVVDTTKVVNKLTERKKDVNFAKDIVERAEEKKKPF